MNKIIAILLVLITVSNYNINTIYAIEHSKYENNELVTDYDGLLTDYDELPTDYIDDLVIMGNWGNDEFEFDYNPNFDINYGTLEFDNYDYDIGNRSVAVVGIAGYATYLATKFIAAAGVTLGVGAASVAGTHFLDSVLNDVGYVFTQMATNIYQTTGEFITGVNVNVMDYMSQAEFNTVMDSVRNFYNPASGNFQYFNGAMVHGSLPLNDITTPAGGFAQVGTNQASLALSRTFGRSIVIPDYFHQRGQRFTVVPSTNASTNLFNYSVLDSYGNVVFSDYFISQSAVQELLDFSFSIIHYGAQSYELGVTATYRVHRTGNILVQSLPVRSSNVDLLVLDNFFTVNPGYSYTYTDELLNPAWDWGTATDKPLVLHPPGTIDLTIPNVTVANPDYPWVVTDVGVINPPLNPPLDPPISPPVTDLSWLDRVMSGFDAVVGATTAGATSVVDAIGTGVTTVTDVVADGFASTVSAVNTGVSSITGSISDAFSWFTAPPTTLIDFSPLYISITQVFPFSLPYDLYNLITYFNSEPEVPVFHVEFDEGLVGSGSFTIDFEPFTSIALILRYFLLLYYVLGLIKLTNLLIGRSG